MNEPTTLPPGEGVSIPYRSSRSFRAPPEGLIGPGFPISTNAMLAGPLGAYAFVCAACYLQRSGENVVPSSIFETLADWKQAGTTGKRAANRAVEAGLLTKVKGGYRLG